MKQLINGVLLAGLFLVGSVQAADRLEKYEAREALDDVKESEVKIELGLATIDLRPGKDEDLIRITGNYDARESDPKLKVDRRGDRAYVSFANNNDKSSHRHHKRDRDIENEDSYKILLSPKPLTRLSVDMGLGKCDMDLTSLRMEEFELNAGLSEVSVDIDAPNPEESSRVTIKSGLGELKTSHLGHLRFDRLRVEGGLGDVELDLRGFEGDGIVDLNVGLGSCDLTVPEDVDVRIYYDGNFMSSIDLDGFDKVSKNEYESEGYGKAKSTLEIDASVGMGNLNIVRRK